MPIYNRRVRSVNLPNTPADGIGASGLEQTLSGLAAQWSQTGQQAAYEQGQEEGYERVANDPHLRTLQKQSFFGSRYKAGVRNAEIEALMKRGQLDIKEFGAEAALQLQDSATKETAISTFNDRVAELVKGYPTVRMQEQLTILGKDIEIGLKTTLNELNLQQAKHETRQMLMHNFNDLLDNTTAQTLIPDIQEFNREMALVPDTPEFAEFRASSFQAWRNTVNTILGNATPSYIVADGTTQELGDHIEKWDGWITEAEALPLSDGTDALSRHDAELLRKKLREESVRKFLTYNAEMARDRILEDAKKADTPLTQMQLRLDLKAEMDALARTATGPRDAWLESEITNTADAVISEILTDAAMVMEEAERMRLEEEARIDRNQRRILGGLSENFPRGIPISDTDKEMLGMVANNERLTTQEREMATRILTHAPNQIEILTAMANGTFKLQEYHAAIPSDADTTYFTYMQNIVASNPVQSVMNANQVPNLMPLNLDGKNDQEAQEAIAARAQEHKDRNQSVGLPDGAMTAMQEKQWKELISNDKLSPNTRNQAATEYGYLKAISGDDQSAESLDHSAETAWAFANTMDHIIPQDRLEELFKRGWPVFHDKVFESTALGIEFDPQGNVINNDVKNMATWLLGDAYIAAERANPGKETKELISAANEAVYDNSMGTLAFKYHQGGTAMGGADLTMEQLVKALPYEAYENLPQGARESLPVDEDIYFDVAQRLQAGEVYMKLEGLDPVDKGWIYGIYQTADDGPIKAMTDGANSGQLFVRINPDSFNNAMEWKSENDKLLGLIDADRTDPDIRPIEPDPPYAPKDEAYVEEMLNMASVGYEGSPEVKKQFGGQLIHEALNRPYTPPLRGPKRDAYNDIYQLLTTHNFAGELGYDPFMEIEGQESPQKAVLQRFPEEPYTKTGRYLTNTTLHALATDTDHLLDPGTFRYWLSGDTDIYTAREDPTKAIKDVEFRHPFNKDDEVLIAHWTGWEIDRLREARGGQPNKDHYAHYIAYLDNMVEGKDEPITPFGFADIQAAIETIDLPLLETGIALQNELLDTRPELAPERNARIAALERELALHKSRLTPEERERKIRIRKEAGDLPNMRRKLGEALAMKFGFQGPQATQMALDFAVHELDTRRLREFINDKAPGLIMALDVGEFEYPERSEHPEIWNAAVYELWLRTDLADQIAYSMLEAAMEQGRALDQREARSMFNFIKYNVLEANKLSSDRERYHIPFGGRDFDRHSGENAQRLGARDTDTLMQNIRMFSAMQVEAMLTAYDTYAQ